MRDLNTANNAVFKDSKIGTVSNISDANQTTYSDNSEMVLSKFILNLRSSTNISRAVAKRGGGGKGRN